LLRPALGSIGMSVALGLGCSDSTTDSPDQATGGANTGGTSAAASGGTSTGGTSTGGKVTTTGGTSTGGRSTGGSSTAGTSGGTVTAGSGGTSTGGAFTGGSGGASTAGTGGASTGGIGTAGSSGSGSGGAAGSGGGSGGSSMKSAGCGKARTLQDGNRTLKSGSMDRAYVLRTPTDYDNTRPYRLIIGFHGAGGKGTDVAPSFFGIWDLSAGSTIFAAPTAVDGTWKPNIDNTMVSDLVKQLSDDLCIDPNRVMIEGFSHGGAMVWTLACALPGAFRAAVVHSGGGLSLPQSCQPIPFFSALGNDGSGQGMSSDYFAKTNGCTVETMPMPPAGGHVCTDYKGCSPGFPVRWCDYDGDHTPSPADSGQKSSWVPAEVWNFIKQY
jgi:predicted esterase